ncbi:unnamed protein product [Microthlaspi erraticum]|uniref:RNase H type-1 domain-containing protein n=1 Tax=Microthlaspi erraticum TaxID=1685480 RepID=A0A6D2JY64_9BRAS|nr:unnamed protein product [Microthlaspi erraticum]
MLLFQRKTSHWRTLVRYGKQDALEYLQAQNTEPQQHTIMSGTGNRNFRWTRPPQGWMKCNFNAGNANSNAGWIIRDSNGVFKGCGYARNDKPTSALEGELQALIVAMQSTWRRGYRKIIFEGDCKQLVDLMNKDSLHFGLYNWLVEAWFWKTKFEEARIAWVPREANRVADKLAKQNIPSSSMFTFLSFPPSCISDVLHSDQVSSF